MPCAVPIRSEEHTSELQSHDNLVCRLLLEKTTSSWCTPASPCTRHPPPGSHAVPPLPREAALRRRVPAAAARPSGGCITLPFFFLRFRQPRDTHPFPHQAPFPS